MRRTSIRKVSVKRQRELRLENEVHRQIWARSGGLCEMVIKGIRCNKPLRWRSSFHEVLFRSHGGKVTLSNTLAVCGQCHAIEGHHLKEV